MTVAEAERAFREMLPCETVTQDISLGRILKLGAPMAITVKRHPSMLTNTILTFQSGEKCLMHYEIARIKICENE